MAAYYPIVVLGLCLVMGYAGQASLGHGAFFAIGGYTSAILTTTPSGAADPAGACGSSTCTGSRRGRTCTASRS